MTLRRAYKFIFLSFGRVPNLLFVLLFNQASASLEYGSPRGVMSVKVATCLATALSFVAILTTLIAVPIIYNEIQSVWQELDDEMAVFRVNNTIELSCNVQFLE